MATIKDYSPEDQKKIQDYIKASGGMADFGTATTVLKVKPSISSPSGSSKISPSSSLSSYASEKYDTDERGWILVPNGKGGYKRLNPKFYDEYGNRINGGSSSSDGSNNEDIINRQYDQQRKSLIAQLRASIAKAKGSYQDIIGKAPQMYQPLRNQTELSKEQQLQAMREALANTGDRGGTGRQELLGINTAAGNQMNAIDLQQQNVINDANSAITGLDEQAAFKESEITADMASQKLQALLAEQQRVDSLNQQQDQFNQQLALQIAGLTGAYNGVQTLDSKRLDGVLSQQEFENNFRTEQAKLDNAYRNNQFTQQQYEFEQNRLFRDKQFEESIRQNNLAQSNWEKQFTYQQMQDKIQNALAQKRISQDSAQIALQQAKFKAEQDPNSLDNQIKKAQLQIALGGTTDAEIREKAAQLATASGMFDQETYNAIYNTLKGMTGYAADAQSNSIGYDASNPYGIAK